MATSIDKNGDATKHIKEPLAAPSTMPPPATPIRRADPTCNYWKCHACAAHYDDDKAKQDFQANMGQNLYHYIAGKRVSDTAVDRPRPYDQHECS